jgi:hypothetical protein
MIRFTHPINIVVVLVGLLSLLSACVLSLAAVRSSKTLAIVGMVLLATAVALAFIPIVSFLLYEGISEIRRRKRGP